jgi:hopene-associated glycosyltransferase HpnB
MSSVTIVAASALAVWAYLLLARGSFWRASERDEAFPAEPLESPPGVTVVIPARNEAEVVGHALASLFAQDYAGPFDIILVDDQSSDATAEAAHSAAAQAESKSRLTVLSGSSVPAGWTGKLWAVKQGIDHMQARAAPADFLFLSDADIAYAPDALRRLIAESRSAGLVLNSRMAKLKCQSLVERAFIPAFIFFFQMLYPFAWVNRKEHSLAAAAGGCVLLRHDALLAAGGIESIRGELIDDCALARRMKAQGPVRLALSERVVSLRSYVRIGEIRRMISRCAYAQLNHSPMLLATMGVAMALTYIGPPIFASIADGPARLLGLASWAAMTIAFQPVLSFYGRSALWGLALPLIAAIYLVFTIDSAWQHRQGRGGLWKGRVQSPRSEAA